MSLNIRSAAGALVLGVFCTYLVTTWPSTIVAEIGTNGGATYHRCPAEVGRRVDINTGYVKESASAVKPIAIEP